MGLAGKGRDFPDIQQHLLVRVVMLHLDQRPRRGDLDAQFFLQFAGQRGGDRFIGLHLAAGKLPQAALMRSVSAARQQNPAVDTADHRCCYMHSFHALFPLVVPCRIELAREKRAGDAGCLKALRHR